MIDRLSTDRLRGAYPLREPAAPKAAAAREGREAAPVTPVPASPPPEVLEALDAAATVIRDLAENRVELHFEVEGGRIRVEVTDGEGNVVRQIPPTRLLDVLAGGSDGLLVDAVV
jgi:flagellar protein FlaG